SAPPPPASAPAATSPDEPADLESIRRGAAESERRRLVTALEATGGNVSAAARSLGMSRYQVLRRLTKYGLR
ncbi:MAG TPA: helix-turn-helix domain-containing protein, partial [Sandaracinaceae bacterium LLY-WYZ-13_1]|nr:helix-turn-helix domain-containing protein [Sandaracinaceae bacterium LLY-WYZ-13_1]